MMRELNYTLDNSSDRYRECLNCNTPFMVQHRLRKFCDNANWCHDEYHNRIKRELKELVGVLEVANIQNHVADPKNGLQQDAKVWSPDYKPQPVEDFGSLQENIQIISQFNFIPSGVEVKAVDLKAFGINANKFSARVPIESEDGIDRYRIEFADYAMILRNDERVRFFQLKDIL